MIPKLSEATIRHHTIASISILQKQKGRPIDICKCWQSWGDRNAAIVHHPEWVIENARRRAASIMNAAQAQYYYHESPQYCG